MMIELQTAAWESVKGRGFFRDENIPPACRNQFQMESFLTNVENMGRQARFVRKNHSVPTALTLLGGDDLIGDALLMAQFVRLVEEVGELARAILSNDKDNAITEAADVYITDANIATTLGAILDDSVRAKLAADERRGLLHGEAVR